MQSLGSIPVAAGQLISLNTRTYTPNQVHGLALFNGSGYWLTVSALGNIQTIPPGVNDLVVLSPTLDVQFTVLAGTSNHNPGVISSEIQGNIYEIQDPLPAGYPFPNPAYVVGNTPTARIGGQASIPAGGGGPGSMNFTVPVGATDRMLAIIVVNTPNIPFFYFVSAVGNVTGMNYADMLTYDAAQNQNLSTIPILIPIIGGVDTAININVQWNGTSGTAVNAWCWVGPDSIFLGTNSLPLQQTDTPWMVKAVTNVSNTTTAPVTLLPPPSGSIAGYQILRTYVAYLPTTALTSGNLQLQGTSGGLNSYANVVSYQAFNATNSSHYIFDSPPQPWVIQDGLSFYNFMTPAGDSRCGVWYIPVDSFYLRNKG